MTFHYQAHVQRSPAPFWRLLAWLPVLTPYVCLRSGLPGLGGAFLGWVAGLWLEKALHQTSQRCRKAGSGTGAEAAQSKPLSWQVRHPRLAAAGVLLGAGMVLLACVLFAPWLAAQGAWAVGQGWPQAAAAAYLLVEAGLNATALAAFLALLQRRLPGLGLPVELGLMACFALATASTHRAGQVLYPYWLADSMTFLGWSVYWGYFAWAAVFVACCLWRLCPPASTPRAARVYPLAPARSRPEKGRKARDDTAPTWRWPQLALIAAALAAAAPVYWSHRVPSAPLAASPPRQNEKEKEEEKDKQEEPPPPQSDSDQGYDVLVRFRSLPPAQPRSWGGMLFRLETQLPQLPPQATRPNPAWEADLYLYKELEGLPICPTTAAFSASLAAPVKPTPTPTAFATRLPPAGRVSAVWRTLSGPPPVGIESELWDLELRSNGDEIAEASPPAAPAPPLTPTPAAVASSNAVNRPTPPSRPLPHSAVEQITAAILPPAIPSTAPPRPAQKVDAIVKWLSTHCILSAQAPQDLSVETFLQQKEGSRRGNAGHIAAATQALLQNAGISARQVRGYRVVPQPGAGRGRSDLLLTPAMKFTWVEIHLRQGGWTPLVFTPANIEKSADESPPPDPELIQALVEETRATAHEPLLAPASALFLSTPRILAALLAAGVLLRLAFLARRLLHPLWVPRTAAPPAALREVLCLLHLVPRKRVYGQFLSDFSQQLAAETPALGTRLSALVAATECAFTLRSAVESSISTGGVGRQPFQSATVWRIYLGFLILACLRFPLLSLKLFFSPRYSHRSRPHDTALHAPLPLAPSQPRLS